MTSAVLLVPPTAGDSTTWGSYAEYLAEGCRVLTFDRKSGCDLEEQAAGAAQAIENAQVGAVAVAGVSLGATIALQLAVDRPELVRALLLHEPPFHAKRHPDLGTIRAVIKTQRMAKRGETVEAAEFFVRWAYRRVDGKSTYDEWSPHWRQVARADGPGVISDIGIATGESIGRRDLAGVTVPVVCTAGALSRPYMRRLVRHLASSLPRGTYVEVPDAGHGAVFEQPRAMATLTMELVQEINPRHRVA